MNGIFLCSWSGGKDSCFAFIKALEQGLKPAVLLNVLNEEGKISRSHGIPLAILKAQATAMNIPLYLISSSWNDYERKFISALTELTETYKLQLAVFGDIDLPAHRDWEEKVCAAANLKAILPLWQQDRRNLVNQMLAAGIETMIVSCNEVMGEKFLGKILTPALIDELESIGVDACGENGEFHTLVLKCPLFTHKLNVVVTDKVCYEGYWFTVLEMVDKSDD